MEFEQPVRVTSVHCYETLGPGTFYKISAIVHYEPSPEKDVPIEEEWITLWEGSESSSNGTARDFCPELSSNPYTKRIKVECAGAGGWLEIDAIKMVGLTTFKAPEISELGLEYKSLLFSERNTYSDVTISLPSKREEIRAHKGLLASRSPYFLKELKESDQIVEIKDNVSFDSLKEAITFLYCDHCNITLENAVEIYTLAETFKVKELGDYCKSTVRKLLTPANTIAFYQLVKEQKMPDLLRVILRLLADFYDRAKDIDVVSFMLPEDVEALKQLRKKKD